MDCNPDLLAMPGANAPPPKTRGPGSGDGRRGSTGPNSGPISSASRFRFGSLSTRRR